MNNHDLEAYLLASRPTSATYSPFTQSVMVAIRQSTMGPADNKPTTLQRIRDYVWHSTLRKAIALVLIILVTACVGLSGHAYATGTNPFTLIKRWIVGAQVKVTYQDPQTGAQREFNHGTKRSYSDLAVSAFAELNLVEVLHFHASNSYTVPQDGIEYIGDPFRTDYLYRRVGTIAEVNNETVVLHLTYSVGHSKMEASQDIDEHITVPRHQFCYYDQGKLVTSLQGSAGKLIVVYQDQYLRHRQHSGERPVPVDLYSAFVLSHSLEAVKEATTTKGSSKTHTEAEIQVAISEQDIHELGLGAWAKTCLGNGAEICPHVFTDGGDNLYDTGITPGRHRGPSGQNPDMIPFGEAVTLPTADTMQYQLRYVEGKIDKISGDRITLKTSSGALWTFQYSVENQQKFARAHGSPLKTGQLLAGGVIASVYDWDRRDFDSQYVFGMSRYQ